jgi:hypothetical protein
MTPLGPLRDQRLAFFRPWLRFRARVTAPFLAERDAEARPPILPPFRDGALLAFLPRPEPPSLRPPPEIAFSVAQARRSASFEETPRCL